jgi:cyclopropane fatty-acyl-phospholipid synthase-like methyltransferase
MNIVKSQMEDIYSRMAPADIPWNIQTPPLLLKDLVEKGTIAPCQALDLGCGMGNYSIYLVSRGFRMTGIDISNNAIRLASKNADEQGVKVRFLAGDFLDDLPELTDPFDFILEWEVLHHVYPEHRTAWISRIKDLLNPGGKYLSVCFHEHDPGFGGKGKYRTTPLGSKLYFSSKKELNSLFRSLFMILDSEVKEITGKSGNHVVNYFLLSL